MPDPDLIAVASIVLLLAGAVKGFVGLGLPTMSLALLTLKYDARTAVALILVPMLFSNIWQFWRGPDMAGCLRRHWRFAVVLFFCVAATVWLTQSAPDRILRTVLGIFTLVFCVMSWRDVVPAIAPHRLRGFELLCAATAGLVGGLTAAWASPLVIFLTGLRLERDDFVQALGLLIAVGSLALFATYPAVGHVTAQDIALSSCLLVPTLIGFAAGEHLRLKSDPKKFKPVFLMAFFLLGINLIAGALFA